MPRDCFPDESTKVHFSAATGFVRSAYIRDQPVSHATSAHGGQVVPMESGYIIIDQAWGRRPQEKLKKLSESEMNKLKRRRKKKK